MRSRRETWRRRLLGRRLRSDARAGAFSGRKAVRLRREFIGRAWQLVIGPPLLALALSPVVLVMPRWSRQFALGVILTSGLWFTAYLVGTMSGAASAEMGQLAEQWTATRLRRLKRRGWQLVNGLRLQTRDLDHILIGPGGVVLVETKYSSDGWQPSSYSTGRVSDAVARLEEDARRLWLWCGKSLVRRERVSAVLVLWGGGYDEQPKTQGEVRIVPGPELPGWLGRLPEDELDASAIAAIHARMVDQVQVRDDRDIAQAGRPARSFQALYALATGWLVVAALGFWGSVGVLRMAGWAWFPLVGAVAAGIAVAARRAGLGRGWWVAWLVGTQAVTLLLLVGYVGTWVQRLV